MRAAARIASLLAIGMGVEAIAAPALVSPMAALVVAGAVVVLVIPLDPIFRRSR